MDGLRERERERAVTLEVLEPADMIIQIAIGNR